MIRPEIIIEELRSNMPDADSDMVWRAYAFAAQRHKGQKRVSGEPYLNHPLEVAHILAKMKLTHISISVGLLHDTIEDTIATPEEIKELFGDEVWQIVDGVTKISMIESATQEEQQAENIRKMILAMAKDIRVILVKLADRIHNMRTLNFLKPEKQRKIARETLDIYAPLANRLGIGWIRSELENTSFKYLWPRDYSEIKHKVANLEAEREKYVEKIVADIDARLKEENKPMTVKGRPKHLYSIFNKMRTQKISFEEVYDIMGVRVITKSDAECYQVLGAIHAMFKPIPGKLKDYIALPKENMYQSLHTTVLGTGGKPVEIQIRSEKMNTICEEGIASHWRYKEGKHKDGKHDEQITWLRRLLEWQQEVSDPREFLEKVKIDLFPDEVYVFTPKQNVKSLPRGATPIDFAYAIHTDVGDHCIGAKINGKIASLRQELVNGDIVDILTSQQARPGRDWLKSVKTSKARTKITSFLRQTEKKRALALGRELLEKELVRLGVNPTEYLEENKLKESARAVGHNSAESVLSALGFGQLKLSTLLPKMLPKETLAQKEQTILQAIKSRFVPKKTEATGVRIQDVDDVLIRFAHCCNPVPGDDIRGFISRGRGLIVHTVDCANSIDLGKDSARYVKVEWDMKTVGVHQALLTVETKDKPGILANVSTAIADNGANIAEASVVSGESGKGILYMTVEVADAAQLQKVMNTILRQDGVYSVERVRDKSAFNAKKRQQGK